MSQWAVQDAKAKFSELLETTISEGPQIVTKRGVETAVLVPIDQWRKLQQSIRRSPIDILVGEGTRFNLPLPKRGQSTWRMDRQALK